MVTMERREYHVVIDYDAEGELVYKFTQPTPLLDMIVEAGQLARWSFTHSPTAEREYVLYLYYGLSRTVPRGENLEELNRRAVECILKRG
jgi:hypothetical protein